MNPFQRALAPPILCLCGALNGGGSEWFRPFDGASLDGWEVRPEERASDWSVVDEVLVGSGSGEESYLMFAEALSDFELAFDYRIVGSVGNTGVEIRGAPVEGKPSRLWGYHADIGQVGSGPKVLGAWDFHEGDRGDYLARRGESVTIGPDGQKHVLPLSDALRPEDLHADGWNSVLIHAEGFHLWFTINGKMASEIRDNQVEKRRASGVIGFQLHSGDRTRVQFRRIRLRRL